MIIQSSLKIITLTLCICVTIICSLNYASAQDKQKVSVSNFGLPGMIDLPTGKKLPDGEIVITHQNHKYLFMNGISFQALPRLGVAFRYGGQGRGGSFAQDRINWDRSFDLHLSVLDEGEYSPSVSVGLRDFIGTGWYSSEYIVATKSFNKIEFTAGLGFGRLSGRNPVSNPLSFFVSELSQRDKNKIGTGGTLGTINWFSGDVSGFYGLRYNINNIGLLAEYNPDLMYLEKEYMDLKSPWNFAVSYNVNDYVDVSAQYLHGSQISMTAQININPARPPFLGGKELAPVPMRMRRGAKLLPSVTQNDEETIRKVLAADRFEVHELKIEGSNVNLVITNTKFRSVAQAVGRLASTVQRFTSDDVKFAYITFYTNNLQTTSYFVDLEKITKEQFSPAQPYKDKQVINAVDLENLVFSDRRNRFTWGVGPYITHRLFNPDLPLSMETGLEVESGYQLAKGLKLSGSLRKSVLSNLTDNNRRSNSILPRVHSDWPLYDIAGQSGHIHNLDLSYTKNLGPGLYGRAHAGFLEPFYAGFGGEILYKPANSSIGIGVDIHQVRKRDYDMMFGLRDYETTVGHVSLYYDAGDRFKVQVNAGRYLAGDWGVTTTISRSFGSGWEVGGYATFTDVPFDTFGEGSFDKAIFLSIPIDWFISSPNLTRRLLNLRPITRDGGANLSSSRQLYGLIERSQNAQFERESGRLWK